MQERARSGQRPRAAFLYRSWERSGGFCCPAPPAAAEFPSVARWVQPRYFRVTSGREALNYAAMASASLSLALVSFAQFNGLHGPGENIAFQHTSILVRPRQKAPEGPFWWSRRVLPPGPLRLLHDTIYHHSRANPALSIWSDAPGFSSHSCARGSAAKRRKKLSAFQRGRVAASAIRRVTATT